MIVLFTFVVLKNYTGYSNECLKIMCFMCFPILVCILTISIMFRTEVASRMMLRWHYCASLEQNCLVHKIHYLLVVATASTFATITDPTPWRLHQALSLFYASRLQVLRSLEGVLQSRRRLRPQRRRHRRRRKDPSMLSRLHWKT